MILEENEDKRNKYIISFLDKSFDKDGNAYVIHGKKLTFDDVLLYISLADPIAVKTKGKKNGYFNAILKWWKDDKIKLPDDCGSVNEILQHYNKVVNNMGVHLKPPTEYNSPGDIAAITKEYIKTDETKNAYPAPVIKELCVGDLKTYNPNKWDGEGELCFSGENKATWCVSGKQMFDHYTSNGKLYFVVKVNQESEKRYALIFIPDTQKNTKLEIKDANNSSFNFYMTTQKEDILNLKQIVHSLFIKNDVYKLNSDQINWEDIKAFFDIYDLIKTQNPKFVFNFIDHYHGVMRDDDKNAIKDIEKIMLRDPQYAEAYSEKFIKGQWPEAEPIIATSAKASYWYAQNILMGRFKLGEPAMAKNANIADDYYTYMMNPNSDINHERWLDAEPVFVTDPGIAVTYAKCALGQRWPEAEPYIIREPMMAMNYAKNLIKGRWPECEKNLANYLVNKDDGYTAVKYADLCHKTWLEMGYPEVERIILHYRNNAVSYCRIVKGRWPEAEQDIMHSPLESYEYAKYVLKKRWPEAEHEIKTNTRVWDDYKHYFNLSETAYINVKLRKVLNEPTLWEKYKEFLK